MDRGCAVRLRVLVVDTICSPRLVWFVAARTLALVRLRFVSLSLCFASCGLECATVVEFFFFHMLCPSPTGEPDVGFRVRA